jgi:hypothetical protein
MKVRKAQIGRTLTLIVATITIFLILFVFWWLSDIAFKFKFRKQGVVLELISQDEAIASLRNFLDSKVEIVIDGSKEIMAMTDLIRLYHIENAYGNKLREESEKIFEKFSNCYLLSFDGLVIGNPQLYFDDAYTTRIPTSSKESIEIGLVLDDECLEKKNEK